MLQGDYIYNTPSVIWLFKFFLGIWLTHYSTVKQEKKQQLNILALFHQSLQQGKENIEEEERK